MTILHFEPTLPPLSLPIPLAPDRESQSTIIAIEFCPIVDYIVTEIWENFRK